MTTPKILVTGAAGRVGGTGYLVVIEPLSLETFIHTHAQAFEGIAIEDL